jgi:hypothetical protein
MSLTQISSLVSAELQKKVNKSSKKSLSLRRNLRGPLQWSWRNRNPLVGLPENYTDVALSMNSNIAKPPCAVSKGKFS